MLTFLTQNNFFLCWTGVKILFFFLLIIKAELTGTKRKRMLNDDAVLTVFIVFFKKEKRDNSTRRLLREVLARKTLINNLLEETVESEDGEDHDNLELLLSIAEKSVGTDLIVTIEVETCIHTRAIRTQCSPTIFFPDSKLDNRPANIF